MEKKVHFVNWVYNQAIKVLFFNLCKPWQQWVQKCAPKQPVSRTFTAFLPVPLRDPELIPKLDQADVRKGETP